MGITIAVVIVSMVLGLFCLMVFFNAAEKIRARRKEGLSIYPVVSGCFLGVLIAIACLVTLAWFMGRNLFPGKIGG